jgi:hypothetical protein
VTYPPRGHSPQHGKSANLAVNECVESTERGPRWTLAKHDQDVSAVLVPMGELIADVPAPGSNHGKNKPPTLCEQPLIETPDSAR